MKRRYVLPIIVLAGLPTSAQAVVFTSITSPLTQTWTDLGAGPLYIQANNSSGIVFQISDSAPAPNVSGFTLQGNSTLLGVNTSSHIFVREVNPNNRNAIVLSAPLTAATGGGGGGGSVTQGTSPWVDNITQWASVALGTPTNYGTAPTGIAGSVNAFVTNPVAVTGTFFQSIQPVSQSGTWTVAQGAAGATAWKVDGSGVTQPVSVSGTPSINNAQVNGVTVATGTGASNTGTPRVAISTDSTFAITNTSFAATQSGTWNVGLLAGSAIVGKVGIDQTTPGVTNGVVNTPITGATLTTSQPSVTTTATALTFSGTAHREIYNPAASTASIFIGATGVTTSTGWEIPPGASSGDLSRFSGSVFAVAASSVTVRLISY